MLQFFNTMKKFTLIKFIYVSVFIFTVPMAQTQEISEDFLKTLPAGMQDDVLNRVNEQGKNADPIYSSIETQTKLEKKELKDLKNRLEDDLEYLKNILQKSLII